VKEPPLSVDPRSGEPSYAQLARQIRERIEAGKIPPHHRVPSIRRMVQETGLSTGTVRHAIQVLADQQWVYTVPGRGTYAGSRPKDGTALPDDT
jgi:DNA-binding GntR family transcriptional regulator